MLVPAVLADVTFSTEGMVVIGALIATLTGVVGKLFQMLIASKDAQMKDMESRAKSYEEISGDALTMLEKDANGGAKPALVAAIVPEHSSSTTKKQRTTAALQTMRARLVAVTLRRGGPARVESQPAEED